MPTIEELFDGRDNFKTGIRGTEYAVRRFRMVLDTYDQNPVLAFQTPGNGGLPAGSPHPWDNTWVASALTIRPRLTSLVMVVEVEYGPAIFFPNGFWRRTIRTASQQETALHYIDKSGPEDRVRPIGPHAYTDEDVYFRLVDTTPQPRLPQVDETKRYHTIAVKNNIPYRVNLLRVQGDEGRRAQGITIKRSYTEITYRTICTDLAKPSIHIHNSWTDTTNSVDFEGFPPDAVYLAEIFIDESVGVVDGQPITGLVYDVGLTFLVDSKLHQPIEAVEQYTSDGQTYNVIDSDTNEPALQYYDAYGRGDFYQLLAQFLPLRATIGRTAPKR